MTPSCDTSVLVAALVSWHESHDAAREAVADVRVVPAHVLLETYSVLTRLPAARRVAPVVAAAALASLPWRPLSLSATDQSQLITELAAADVSGGASYDALIAATARRHGLTLLSLDRRAHRTYDALGVDHRLV
ncbi:PIN domain-containing protein [Microbacterium sp. KR10-403]|uniref:PIN domain-containing protein n=1 Tax=Microbacterium sp. KR10-403 TaxID=3158581 RepID=UPI0032E462A2